MFSKSWSNYSHPRPGHGQATVKPRTSHGQATAKPRPSHGQATNKHRPGLSAIFPLRMPSLSTQLSSRRLYRFTPVRKQISSAFYRSSFTSAACGWGGPRRFIDGIALSILPPGALKKDIFFCFVGSPPLILLKKSPLPLWPNFGSNRPTIRYALEWNWWMEGTKTKTKLKKKWVKNETFYHFNILQLNIST